MASLPDPASAPMRPVSPLQPPPADPAPERTRDDLPRAADIDAELLAIAYGRLGLSLMLTVGVVVLFAGLLWPRMPDGTGTAWLGLLLATSALRYLDLRAWRRAPQPDAGPWRQRFALGAVAGGLSWSFGPIATFAVPGFELWPVLALTTVAAAAVSTSSMSSQRLASWAFIAATVLPTVTVLILDGGTVEVLAALVQFVFGAALAVIAHVSHRALRAQIETRLQLSEALAEAARARALAEDASRAKSRFLANMSHELRTPLNAVLGATQLMRAAPHDPSEQARLVEIVDTSGRHLLSLIEDVLDLSRIEAGQLALQHADFELSLCVDDAIAAVEVVARDKNLRLVASIAPNVPIWRFGDAARVRQLLLNLLANSVKFTERGGVRMTLSRGATADEVRVEVTDTGIGIPPELLGQVFEPFRRTDDGPERHVGGTGLGLAIVRQLAMAMGGGGVRVSSVPGRGSRFEVSLRLPVVEAPAGLSADGRGWLAPAAVQPARAFATAAPEAAAATSDPFPASGPALSGLRVLLAEDDRLNRTIVADLLRRAGAQVTTVDEGGRAIDALAAAAFDVVLMDWQMPGVDGISAARRIRDGEAGEARRAVPIVALTANAMAEDRAACYAAGMNDFVSKPIEAGALIRTIARWGRPARQGAPDASPAPDGPSAA